MLKIGLTGGIGSGKTTVAKIFTALGIPVFNADASAAGIVNTNEEVKTKIKLLFGDDIYDAEGLLFRKKVAEKVFGSNELLQKLNKIIHPAVKNDFIAWLENQNSHYIIKEAAILFESGSDKDMDFVIAVSSPKELRLKRILERDNRSSEEIEQIMQQQIPEEEINKKTDFIIYNDELQLLIPQVLKLHQHFHPSPVVNNN